MTKKKKEDKSIEKEFKFSGAAYRLKDESYEEYRARQKMLKAIQKQKLKGEKIWPSHIMGTYRKEFKGREKEMIEGAIDYVKKLDKNKKSG